MDSQFLDPSWRNLNPSGNIINTIYEHKYTKQLCFFPPFDPQHLIQVYMLVKKQYSLDFSFLAQDKQFFQAYQEIKQQETTLADHLNIRRFGEIMQGAIESAKAEASLDGAKLRKYNIIMRGINSNYGLAVSNSKIIANSQLQLQKEKAQLIRKKEIKQELICKKIKQENNEISVRKVEVNESVRIAIVNKADQMMQEMIKQC